MPPKPTTQEMGDRHETRLAEALGGTKTSASGSQWTQQADGYDHHDDPIALRWDGKSTRGKQIAVTRDMIDKIRDQAHGERPVIGLRWYDTDVLDVGEDWVMLQLADVEEMLPFANAAERLAQANADLRRELEQVRADRDRWAELAQAAQEGRMIPPHVPRLPWTVVHLVHLAGRTEMSGLHYAQDGAMRSFAVGTVRVERWGGNRPRLIVNDKRVSDGDLYVDGQLRARACVVDKDAEVG